MSTIINNPSEDNGGGFSSGLVIGIIVIIIILILVFVVGANNDNDVDLPSDINIITPGDDTNEPTFNTNTTVNSTTTVTATSTQ